MIAPSEQYDVVIVGAGPGGSALATLLGREGLRVALVEKDAFPRYHIGESLTGECGAVVRRLGLEKQMQALAFPIKHGVRVYGADPRSQFWVPVAELRDDGVRISSYTWQVRRDDFDKLLLDTALESGAELIRAEALAPEVDAEGSVTGVRVRGEDGDHLLNAGFTVDASGQALFMARRSDLTGEIRRGTYDKQLAIYGQFRNTRRDPEDESGNPLIFYKETHHWAWFIPLSDEHVSVGVTVPSRFFTESGLSKDAFLRQAVLECNPELSDRMVHAELDSDVHTSANYSYSLSSFVGKNFICIGDAHQFVDPIFSFGVFFTMKEAELAAPMILGKLRGKTDSVVPDEKAFERVAQRGQDVIQTLIDCFWREPLAFSVMAHATHTDEIIDYFAGRLYTDREEGSDALDAMQRILARDGSAGQEAAG